MVGPGGVGQARQVLSTSGKSGHGLVRRGRCGEVSYGEFGCGKARLGRQFFTNGGLKLSSKNVYKLRVGYSLPVKPQVVGETLERIAKRNNGIVSAHDVVEEARPENSSLHPCFDTWDVAEAAELHWIEQARKVIRSVEVIVTDKKTGKEAREIAYVSVCENPQDGSMYMSTRKAMSNSEIRQRIIDDADSQLMGWHRRYGHLVEIAKEFGPIIEAINSLINKRKLNKNKGNSNEKATRTRQPVPVH